MRVPETQDRYHSFDFIDRIEYFEAATKDEGMYAG